MFDALARRAEELPARQPAGGGFQYVAGTDMAGNPLYRISMDGGARRSLIDVAGQADPRLGRARARVPHPLRPGRAPRTAT